MAWFLIRGGGESLWWPIRGGSTQKGYLFQASGIWKVGVLLVEVYERPVEKSVIWVSEMAQRAEQMNFYGFIKSKKRSVILWFLFELQAIYSR